jgi:hypothetical protein
MEPRRTMAREAGTALAVLAIYVLTLLAPLHHARASQLAFEELGYSTLGTGWVLCMPGQQPGSDGERIAPACPAVGAGKSDLVLPPFSGLPLRFDRVEPALAWNGAPAAIAPRHALPPCGSRAPPCEA